ncbi:GtrA family protein [Massilia agilis]|uniref:GtrA family protein n=1 Tax=Massilia agilis TaxID=1811226 RepID=A0ABT2DDB1_9BURK|nr:GtrA family protein [Massilia agilis]MCS0809257.1 GtrA family protein [Massilia agilis]
MPEHVALPRFVLYAAAGAVGTAGHYAVLATLVWAAWLAPDLASMCGALVGAGINFLLNARLTFRRRATLPAAWRFGATALAAAAANGLAMALLTRWLRVPWLAAQALVTALLLTLTFLVNSRWTFRSNPR